MPEQPSNRAAIERWILERTPEGGRVLDIGCGDGELLAALAKERRIHGTGIELSEERVLKAIQRGLSVHHGDIEEGLDDYGDASFDLVLLSLTIQELRDPRRAIAEAFRVGKRVIITFPNLGHFRARWDLAVRGRAPVTQSLPYIWCEGPNRHHLTVADWESLVRAEGWLTIDRGFLAGGRLLRFFPNLRSEVALYLMERGGWPAGDRS